MKFSITFFPLINTSAKLLSANVSEFGILTTIQFNYRNFLYSHRRHFTTFLWHNCEGEIGH